MSPYANCIAYTHDARDAKCAEVQPCCALQHAGARAIWSFYLEHIDCNWKLIAYCFTVSKRVLDCCEGIHRQSAHRNLQRKARIVSLK